METLRQRLDSLQNELLSLYEKDSNDIRDQILHWNLNRREQALLHYARQQGLNRLGMQMVPALTVSQTRAKGAIEMELMLTSLSTSRFGNEGWTLQETSRELFNTAPKHTFKKGPRHLDMIFDGNSNNTVHVPFWQYIYYQDETDEWHRSTSAVDSVGIYFVQGTIKVYYTKFQSEASKYGFRTWQVSHDNKPLHSSSSVGSRGPSPHSKAPSTPIRRGGGRRAPRRRSPSTFSRSHKEASGSSGRGETPPSARDVGSSTETPPRGNQSRLRSLLHEARDPPLLVLKGPANTLKCLRYRLKGRFSHTFCNVTSTWHWTLPTGTEKCVRSCGSRMIVTFSSTEQRNLFCTKVPLPSSVTAFTGSFNGE
ncbi:E2 protein [Talpa europaea papillomavirus 1]|uniref:Regulatory protein E2 n=1 Tax=Talpa europaea papillomavirus 1 TaxID=1338506 RepID=R9RX83_9PAPI|nr:E2 protein [Talpa europaea papillomavirus 1]